MTLWSHLYPVVLGAIPCGFFPAQYSTLLHALDGGECNSAVLLPSPDSDCRLSPISTDWGKIDRRCVLCAVAGRAGASNVHAGGGFAFEASRKTLSPV